MQEISDFNTYYWLVAGEAIEQGYTVQQVRIFYGDILDYYHKDKTVQECVEEIF